MAKYYFRRLIFFGTLIAIIIITISIFTSDTIPLWLDVHTFQEGIRTVDGKPIMSLDEVVPEDENIIIVVFWSTKCKYCHKLLMELNSQDWQVIAINVRDSQASVEKYVTENQIKHTVLLGMPTPPSTGLPHTQVVVRNYGVFWEKLGYATIEEIEEVVNAIKELQSED